LATSSVDTGAKQEERLLVEGLTVAYGKIPAVRGVSLVIDPGEIVALAGPNSAGKSSILNAVATKSRWVAVTGRISIAGRRIDGLATRERWASGVRLVPQGRQIFPSLNVEDNLRVVADNLRIPWTEALDNSQRLFPQIFLKRLDTAAGNLSGGEQQMLALARVLIGKPRVLLLDEPGLGLARGVIRDLVKAIESLRKEGMAVLIADQGIQSWETIVSKTFVLLRGQIVGVAADRHGVEKLMGMTAPAPQ
jgi:branched-chain amino acid transport system ATP-binding protein